MAFTEPLLPRKGHFLSRKRGRLFKKYFFHSLNGAFKPRKKGTFFTFKKSGGGTCPNCPPGSAAPGSRVMLWHYITREQAYSGNEIDVNAEFRAESKGIFGISIYRAHNYVLTTRK
jgi:hypothetical protein